MIIWHCLDVVGGNKLTLIDKSSGWSTLQFNKTATLTGLTIDKTYVIAMHWIGGGMDTTELAKTYGEDTPKNSHDGRVMLSVIKATATTVTITETGGTLNYQGLAAMQLD